MFGRGHKLEIECMESSRKLWEDRAKFYRGLNSEYENAFEKLAPIIDKLIGRAEHTNDCISLQWLLEMKRLIE